MLLVWPILPATSADRVRRSIVKGTPPEDPFRDWIGGSDTDPAQVDETVYGS